MIESHVHVTTSWDDGHPCDLRVAEMLSRHGLPGTFYVPQHFDEATDVTPPSRYTTLGPGIEVGAHTLHHVELTRTPDALADREITDSKKWIEDQTGRPCAVFCPPKGWFHARHLPMIADAGFLGLRTVEGWSLDKPRRRAGVLEMPTTVQAHPSGTLPNLRNLVKRRAVRSTRRYLKNGLGQSWRTALRRCIAEVSRTGGVLHLWGHSWEVDAADQWRELDAAFALLAELCAQPHVQAVTNGQLARTFAPRPAAKPDAAAHSPAHPRADVARLQTAP